MNFDFLENMDNDDEEIEIQYHPHDQADALKLKQFIEYQIQTLDVIDKNHQIRKIRIAMIYSIDYNEKKAIIYGKTENYELNQSWDTVSKLFNHTYFLYMKEKVLINRYHIKKIYKESIVLDNGSIFYI